MQCPNCRASIDTHTIYCGNCGKQVAPLQARGATASYNRGEEQTEVSLAQTPVQQANVRYTPAQPTIGAWGNTPPPVSAGPRRRRPFLLVGISALIVLLIGGTVLAVALSRNTSSGNSPGGTTTTGNNVTGSGQAIFLDGTNGSGGTDAIRITVNGLSAPSAGTSYNAWLVDDVAERTTSLGKLNAQGNTFTLSFNGNGSHGQPGQNLLSAGNVVEITQEQGDVQLPTGKVILSATFPPKAFVHIKHLLFSFPTTPAKIGLLVGLVDATRLLNAQALALQSIASTQDAGAIKCIAQSIIDIIEGQQGQNAQVLPAACGASIPVGDGFGILGKEGYANTAATHASLAATQTDTTALIRQHASEVQAGTANITKWATTIDQDALKVLANPSDQASIAEIVTLADHTFHGVDANGNGQIEAVAGEEGATNTYLNGQAMATLDLLRRA